MTAPLVRIGPGPGYYVDYTPRPRVALPAWMRRFVGVIGRMFR